MRKFKPAKKPKLIVRPYLHSETHPWVLDLRAYGGERQFLRHRADALVFSIEAKRSPQCIGYAQFYSRSHHAVIRVYDEAGNVIQTHEHKGDFKEW
jgi:hypothetical protein